ncbi:MAG TPA: hypothetical protein VEK73_04200, partial [Xanthobacteraceae bacterium]|nr:hypothetical protein [Xanthobacteraceae bacterium]
MAQVISVPYVSLTTFTVIQRYYAFIWDLNNNTLALNVSVDGGATWTWPSLGTAPAGAQTPAAATAFFSGKVAADGSGINQFYAFVIGSDGNLWVCVSLDDGNTWNWQNQG